MPRKTRIEDSQGSPWRPVSYHQLVVNCAMMAIKMIGPSDLSRRRHDVQATFGAEVACPRGVPQAGTKVSLPKKFWCPTTRRWRPSGATGLGATGTRKQQDAGVGLTRLRRRLRVETARCAGTTGPTGKRRGCKTQCPREHPVVTTRLRSSLRFALVLATRKSTDACYTPPSPAH